MRSLEEIENALRQDPDNFNLLYEYTVVLHGSHHYRYAFVSTERAIAVFESAPTEANQAYYLELKKFRQRVLANHLDDILGGIMPFLDSRWTPVFKLGRPREIALIVNRNNVRYLSEVVTSDQLKRLRFLSLTIDDCADEALEVLQDFRFDPIRVMNLCLNADVSASVYESFWQRASQHVTSLSGLSCRMPHLSDRAAITTYKSVQQLESFSLLSLDRTTMSEAVCDCIADDERSNSLTSLAIVGSSIGDKGLMSLLQSDYLESLQSLDLHDGVLTNATARLISADFKLPQLRSIDLRYNQIDPSGVSILSRIPLEIKLDSQHRRPTGRIPSQILSR